MVKKKITKKAVDAEEDIGGSIGGNRYKSPSRGKAMDKEPAKGKTVPKKSKTVPEKDKPESKTVKAKTVPKKAKAESQKVKAALKKSKIVSKKAKTVADSELQVVSDTVVEERPLIARCRPHTLEFMLSTFSPNQNKAVEKIGFGGLLHLKLKTLNRQMVHWLIEHFNGGSCMFTIAAGKEFVVTKNDICDVFGLPMSEIAVPELQKNHEEGSVDKRII